MRVSQEYRLSLTLLIVVGPTNIFSSELGSNSNSKDSGSGFLFMAAKRISLRGISAVWMISGMELGKM